MKDKAFNQLAAAGTGAILAGGCMLLLGLGWNIGLYQEAAQQMAKWHLFFSPSFRGILAGMIEAAVWAFVLVYLAVWIYRKLA